MTYLFAGCALKIGSKAVSLIDWDENDYAVADETRFGEFILGASREDETALVPPDSVSAPSE